MTSAIGIIHLGAANYASIASALERFGVKLRFVHGPDELAANDGLVFPGVANFGFVADELDRRNMRQPLTALLRQGMPYLGICAGFQLLYARSAEAPQAHGLGLLQGGIEKLKAPKLPHIGWSPVHSRSTQFEAGWAFFAHAYAPGLSADTQGETVHGHRFTSIACRNSAVGVQFHPERSGRYGAAVLHNFLKVVRHAR